MLARPAAFPGFDYPRTDRSPDAGSVRHHPPCQLSAEIALDVPHVAQGGPIESEFRSKLKEFNLSASNFTSGTLTSAPP